MTEYGESHFSKTEKEPVYPPEMQRLIERLRVDPTIAFSCAHNHDDAAVVICYVPQGCVALPGLEVQPLCPQHQSSNGSFNGMKVVIDLSVDGAWSEFYGGKPDFIIKKDPETEILGLVELSE